MDTQTSTSGTAVGQYDWCDFHKGPSQTARLVRIIETASGPGRGMYACAPCREQRGLTPVTDTPIPDLLAEPDTETDLRRTP
ncbi:hypothetical protein ACFXKX_38515 [Streptomyces scopuliridis]|uniref:hypothetical protein n=1 Tax=Streptomyces scopuliridis TaxID=452529 RepID=UPI0036A333F1